MRFEPRRPLMASAHRTVRAAVLRGDLTDPRQLQCTDCGRSATRYDHRDYTAPLLVEPVCHRCNCRRGAGLPYERQDTDRIPLPIWMPEIAI